MIRVPAALVAVLLGVALTAGCSGSGGAPAPPPGPPITNVPAPAPIQPVRVDIPQINAHSTLIPLGLLTSGPRKGAVDEPDVNHPQQAGYFCVAAGPGVPPPSCSSGVAPGQLGPAIIIGHVDGSPAGRGGAHQLGVFFHLHELRAGDVIDVTRADGSVVSFEVYRSIQVAKTGFPSNAVYGNTATPELRLITCTGRFVGGQFGYNDNIIVFAKLKSVTPPTPAPGPVVHP